MAVYVDNMQARYGQMVMCHMAADTSAELLIMAQRIGVRARWIQKRGTYAEHFDICQAKRRAAIAAGALQITSRELVRLMMKKRGSN